MHTIETDIPQPTQDCRTKYPFLSLQIGESFTTDGLMLGSVRARASQMGKAHGRRFRVCKQAGGLRVWRVS